MAWMKLLFSSKLRVGALIMYCPSCLVFHLDTKVHYQKKEAEHSERGHWEKSQVVFVISLPIFVCPVETVFFLIAIYISPSWHIIIPGSLMKALSTCRHRYRKYPRPDETHRRLMALLFDNFW